MPKLILLNGFAGGGKTTIATKYIADHALALMIETDELIVKLGQWTASEPEARHIVFELAKSLAKTQLQFNKDVVLPYLVTQADHAAQFEKVAQQAGADFYEIILFDQKATAINKLLKRGTWGEAGLPPLDTHNAPVIEDLYDRMVAQLQERPGAITVQVGERTVDDIYAEVLKLVVAP